MEADLFTYSEEQNRRGRTTRNLRKNSCRENDHLDVRNFQVRPDSKIWNFHREYLSAVELQNLKRSWKMLSFNIYIFPFNVSEDLLMITF